MRVLVALALGVVELVPLATHGQLAAQRGRPPARGFVPDSITAVRIAEAVWIPIYGADQIRSERPYVAILKNNVWFVRGTLGLPVFSGHLTAPATGWGTEVSHVQQASAPGL